MVRDDVRTSPAAARRSPPPARAFVGSGHPSRIASFRRHERQIAMRALELGAGRISRPRVEQTQADPCDKQEDYEPRHGHRQQSARVKRRVTLARRNPIVLPGNRTADEFMRLSPLGLRPCAREA